MICHFLFFQDGKGKAEMRKMEISLKKSSAVSRQRGKPVDSGGNRQALVFKDKTRLFCTDLGLFSDGNARYLPPI
jgi:hypothetical protein